MADGYEDLAFTANADPDRLRQRAVGHLEASVPGYVSSPANPEQRILAETGEIAADREAVAVDVSRGIFRAVVKRLYGIQPIDATHAIGATTWVFADTLGHDIPYGTQLSKDGQLFTVSLASQAPVGETTVTGVPIIAAVAGSQGSGLSGTMRVEDALPGSPTVTLEGVTTNGQDAEPEDELENRAARRIRTWGRPTRPEDVETIALEVVGVHRVLAIDEYKPGPPYDTDPAATGVRRTVTAVPVDDQGQPCSAGVKTVVLGRLQAEREASFLFWVIDPTYTSVKVTAQITVRPGYDPQVVVDAANAALAAYVNPARWGDDLTGELPSWHDEPTVLRGELYTVLNNVSGVRHVKPGTLLLNDADQDVALAGPAPLPTLHPDSAITLAA